MSIILDLIVAVIIAVLLIGGYRRGLARAVVGLLGSFFSSVASVLIASIASTGIYNVFVKDYIVKTISDNMPDIDIQTKAADISDSLMHSLPAYAKNALEIAGVTPDKLINEISSANTSVPELVEGMIRPVLIKLITVILTMIIFLILTAVIAAATKTIDSFVNIKGVKTVNKILGGILGLMEALVLIMIMSMLIYFLLVLLPVDVAESLQEGIDRSLLYQRIYYINLPELIMTKLLSLAL